MSKNHKKTIEARERQRTLGSGLGGPCRVLGRAGALGPSRWATLAPGPGRARVGCGAAARPYGRAEAGSGGRAAHNVIRYTVIPGHEEPGAC